MTMYRNHPRSNHTQVQDAMPRVPNSAAKKGRVSHMDRVRFVEQEEPEPENPGSRLHVANQYATRRFWFWFMLVLKSNTYGRG